MLKLATLTKTGTDKAAVAVSGSAVITKTIEMNAADHAGWQDQHAADH